MRVASLYLPNLPTDRLRRIERKGERPDPSKPLPSMGRGWGGVESPEEAGAFSSVPPPPNPPPSRGRAEDQGTSNGEWLPPARWPENTKERTRLIALRERLEREREAPPPEPGTRIEDCSCPRGGGWRPGARWAREENGDEWLERRIARKTEQKAALQARLETMPVHQRPPIRELGRRSEPMPNPFRPMTAKADEGANGRAPYDLDGAFWQQGRSLGGAVARAVGTGKTGQAAAAPPQREDHPPLVTVRRERQRMVIAAACPAAQALGLAAGMPLTQARALVPGLDIRPADPEGEAADLERLARHAARHWTPQVNIVPGEGLWLDIAATAHLFGGEAGFARRVLTLCRRLGLAARIAIADTAAAAHALAKCALQPLILCPPGREADAIAPLPLSALRLDQPLIDRARRLGIETIGALADIPRAPLVRRFGQSMVARLDEALGRRAQPLDQLIPTETPAAQRRFSEPLLTAEPIASAVAELVGELCALLGRDHQGARQVALTLTRVDTHDQRIEIGLARPSRDPAHITRLLGTKLDQVEPGFGIERITIVAERFDPLAPEAVPSSLAGREPAADEAVLIDRLATRLGSRSLYRLGAVESDVPERSIRRLPPTDHTAPAWHPWPRPIRLLDPPERVEGVIALLPDGVPKRFTWRGRSYSVVRGDGPERIHGEWWRRTAERDSVRDYFQVEDQAGARFWLFRRGDAVDDRTGNRSWHLHGLFA